MRDNRLFKLYVSLMEDSLFWPSVTGKKYDLYLIIMSLVVSKTKV